MKPSITKAEYHRVRKAIEDAEKRARAASGSLAEALRNIESVTSETAKQIFQRQAERFLAEYENWQQSAGRLGAVLGGLFAQPPSPKKKPRKKKARKASR